MNKLLKNKKLLITLAVVAVAVVVFIIIRRRRNAAIGEDLGSGSGSGSSVNTIALMPEAVFPLKPGSAVKGYSAAAGSYGKQIVEMQKLCNAYDPTGTQLKLDGKYGTKTLAALRSCYDFIPADGSISQAMYNDDLCLS